MTGATGVPTGAAGATIHEVVLSGPRGQELLAFESAGHHTRGDLDDRARRTARRLQSYGVGPGRTVAVVLPNRIQFVDVILATSLLGGVVVPLHVAARGEMLDRALRLADPAVLVGAATLEAQWRPVVEARGIPAVVVDDRDGTDGSGARDGTGGDPAAILDGGPDPDGGPVRDDELPEVRPGDPVIVYASSGTTGPAKGVTLCHRALVEMTVTAQTVMRYTADDVAYTPMPLFHANAFVFTFLSAVRAGARTIIAERFHASDFWRRLTDFGVTKTSLLGSAPSLLLLQPEGEHDHAHRVELIAAVPRPPDVADFEARFGVPVTEFYGSTEANLPIGIPYGSERRPRSCGRLLPGWEHMIADEEGNPVPPGEPGELCIRPTKPNVVSSGYWG
ncbi:MAG TPA: AMP-binding protein, partial [Acidimicrobiales bacterium]